MDLLLLFSKKRDAETGESAAGEPVGNVVNIRMRFCGFGHDQLRHTGTQLIMLIEFKYLFITF